jgi:hypothetical protein
MLPFSGLCNMQGYMVVLQSEQVLRTKIFWDVTMADGYRRFGRMCCLNTRSLNLKLEAELSSKTTGNDLSNRTVYSHPNF